MITSLIRGIIITASRRFLSHHTLDARVEDVSALRAVCIAEGRGVFFDAVSGALSGQASHGDQTAMATSCGMSFDAFRMAISRLKKRLRQCVKAEMAGPLDDPAAVQAEMGALFAALGTA